MQQTTGDSLQSRQHFQILDGLRGIAALSVVTFHFMEIVFTDAATNFIGHGFLAVDFFFCLSGFVIAYAYDRRIGKTGVGTFFKLRFIRLHPLVLLGSVLGLLTFLFDPFGSHRGDYSVVQVSLIFLCSVFLIPYPVMPDRYFNNFGLNAPSWSLFWEYMANIVYGFVLWRLNRRWLLVLFGVSAVLLFRVALVSDSLVGGWDGKSFWDGGARVAYSFLAGMIVYRFKIVISNKLGFLGLSALLFLAFVVPFNTHWNWLTESFLILIWFPLIVAFGSGASPGKNVQRICDFAGKFSYPLYMTHYAFMWAFGNYNAIYKPQGIRLAMIVIPSLFLLTAFAWLIMKCYDIPVRQFLAGKWVKRPA